MWKSKGLCTHGVRNVVYTFFLLARAGGLEPPLSDWKPTFRPRKPVCYLYTMPALASGWWESNPRLRTGDAPNQDLKSCVLPLHYTRSLFRCKDSKLYRNSSFQLQINDVLFGTLINNPYICGRLLTEFFDSLTGGRSRGRG